MFDRRYGVRTSGRIELAELGLDHPERVYYIASNWRTLHRVLRRYEIGPDDVFIDLGSGMGRMVLEASRFPFKKVIGVELASELHTIAQQNVKRMQRRARCMEIELVNSDILDYDFPDDVTFVYMFNPFRGAIFEATVDKVLRSLDRNPRMLYLIYLNAYEEPYLLSTSGSRSMGTTGTLACTGRSTGERPTRQADTTRAPITDQRNRPQHEEQHRSELRPIPIGITRAGHEVLLRVGDMVEVRSAAEIRATLDDRGELESLPFMPEMVALCGKRLSVHKVAHKVCDTISRSGMRRMTGAVYLTGARCDGAAHGGCETACQFLWKEQWLKRVSDRDDPLAGQPSEPAARELLPLLTINARKDPGADGTERFSCQATELLRAAPARLPFLDLHQYVADVRTGNVSAPWMIRAFLVASLQQASAADGQVSARSGSVPRRASLGLPRGPRVRPHAYAGVGPPAGRTRANQVQGGDPCHPRRRLAQSGMGFDEEMSRYCGQVARVQSRVHRCIDERTGEMLTMKYPCIVLENIICAGAFNVSCPREFIPFWREIWLERVPPAASAGAAPA